MIKYCQQCGSPHKDGDLFCENCGQPISATGVQANPTPVGSNPSQPVQQQPPVPPQIAAPPPRYIPLPPVPPPALPPAQTYAPPPKQKHSSSCGRTILISGGAILGLIVCLGLAGLAVWLIAGPRIQNQIQSSLSNLPSATLAATTLPEPQATENRAPTQVAIATETSVPAQPAATVPAPTQPLSTLTTVAPQAIAPIFLDYTAEWQLADTPHYLTDISQQGYWIVKAKDAGADITVLTPNQLKAGVGSSTVSVNVQAQMADQVLGIRCQVKDEKNYYEVALQNKSFAIGKVLDGNFTPLTDPVWQRSQFIGSQGWSESADISLLCMGNQIGFSVNGTEETPLLVDTDNSFSSGGVAIFTTAGKTPVDGFYSAAGFRDLKIATTP
jgi:hypothetical protein